MKKEKCIFCSYESIKEDILFESENFFVKVGVGILSPGHVMLITKKHFICFGELPVFLHKEFLTLKERIADKIASLFSKPVIYEHGIYSQSVKHAHIHFVPSETESYKLESMKRAFNYLKSMKVNDIFEIKNIYKKEMSYFYLEENGCKWIFHTKGLPEKKYDFRKEFAKLTGLHGLADWQNMPEEEKHRNEEWVRATKDVLKDSSFLP